jgi:hypothetical protein
MADRLGRLYDLSVKDLLNHNLDLPSVAVPRAATVIRRRDARRTGTAPASNWPGCRL